VFKYFFLTIYLFSFAIYAIPLYSCAQCEGECSTVEEIIIWNLSKTSEVELTMDKSLEDAGLFIGQKGCEIAEAQGFKKIIVELIDESNSKYSDKELDIFLKGVLTHIDYIENSTKEITYLVKPDSPFCYMSSKDVFEIIGAELLISCKYLGSTTLISEYNGLHSGEVVLKNDRIGKSKFRCLMTALSRSINDEKLLYIDEVIGESSIFKEFIIREGKELLLFKQRLYKHYEGMSEAVDNYLKLGIISYTDEEVAEASTHNIDLNIKQK
jgi:hypothetical protein